MFNKKKKGKKKNHFTYLFNNINDKHSSLLVSYCDVQMSESLNRVITTTKEEAFIT